MTKNRSFLVYALWIDHGFCEYGLTIQILSGPDLDDEKTEIQFLAKFKSGMRKENFVLFKVEELKASEKNTELSYFFTKKDSL